MRRTMTEGVSSLALGSPMAADTILKGSWDHDEEKDSLVSSDHTVRKLDWRNDPMETHSDWTIEIVTVDDDDKTGTNGPEEERQPPNDVVVQTYHVHKVILSYGVRGSDYFVKVFRDGEHPFQEAVTGTSRIELHPVLANRFPALLDYIYNPNISLQTTDMGTAVAMYHLGDYFRIRQLCKDVKRYLKEKLSFGRKYGLEACYDHANTIGCDGVLNILAKFVADHIGKPLDAGHLPKCIKSASPQFWMKILDYTPRTTSSSSDMSIHITNYCKRNLHVLNEEILRDLLSTERLPTIDPSVAMDLFQVVQTMKVVGSSNGGNGGDDNINNRDGISSVEIRCIRALAKNCPTIQQDINALLSNCKNHQSSSSSTVLLVGMLLKSLTTLNEEKKSKRIVIKKRKKRRSDASPLS